MTRNNGRTKCTQKCRGKLGSLQCSVQLKQMITWDADVSNKVQTKSYQCFIYGDVYLTHACILSCRLIIVQPYARTYTFGPINPLEFVKCLTFDTYMWNRHTWAHDTGLSLLFALHTSDLSSWRKRPLMKINVGFFHYSPYPVFQLFLRALVVEMIFSFSSCKASEEQDGKLRALTHF